MKTMSIRRCFEVLPVALALVFLCAPVPLAGPGDEKKTEETPSKPKKSDATDKKNAEATSKKSGEAAKDASKTRTPANGSIYSKAVRDTDPEVKVFTNEDLSKMAPMPGGAAGSPPATAATSRTVDPLVLMTEQENRALERREMIQTAEQALAAARKKHENLQKQLRATTNPFAARPKLSDEEKELRATSQESAKQRYERTQALVEEAQKEIVAAEQRLARVRAQR